MEGIFVRDMTTSVWYLLLQEVLCNLCLCVFFCCVMCPFQNSCSILDNNSFYYWKQRSYYLLPTNENRNKHMTRGPFARKRLRLFVCRHWMWDFILCGLAIRVRQPLYIHLYSFPIPTIIFIRVVINFKWIIMLFQNGTGYT